jgi:hypothetical protein
MSSMSVCDIAASLSDSELWYLLVYLTVPVEERKKRCEQAAVPSQPCDSPSLCRIVLRQSSSARFLTGQALRICWKVTQHDSISHERMTGALVITIHTSSFCMRWYGRCRRMSRTVSVCIVYSQVEIDGTMRKMTTVSVALWQSRTVECTRWARSMQVKSFP